MLGKSASCQQAAAGWLPPAVAVSWAGPYIFHHVSGALVEHLEL